MATIRNAIEKNDPKNEKFEQIKTSTASSYRNLIPVLTSTLVALVLATQASPAMAVPKGWDKVVKGASTTSNNLSDFCKQHEEVKIWVEGASTAHISGLACKTVTVHVEGVSTLCLTGTGTGKLQGSVSGGSTLVVFEGFAKSDDISTSGASTYKRNTGGSFTCGLIGRIPKLP